MTRGFLAAALGLTGVAALAASCELVTKRSGLQCETTSDCTARGGQFAQSICSSTGVCELVQLPEASVPSCLPGSGGSEQCTIALNGVPGRCVDEKCISLDPMPQGMCAIVGPASNDSALLIGVIVPSTASGGGDIVEVAQGLAFPSAVTNQTTYLENTIDTWNEAVEAVQATKDGGGASALPKFAAIVCDEGQINTPLPDGGLGPLGFLQTLKTKLIVGPLSGIATAKVISTFGNQAAIFSPLGDDNAYAVSPSGTTVSNRWFCSPNRNDTIASFRSAVDLVARNVAAKNPKGYQIKVALMYDSLEPNEQDFFIKLTTDPALTFNDEAATASNLLSEDVGIDVTQIAGENIDQAEAVAKFAPDVVVLTGAVWSPYFINSLEGRWVIAGGKARPTYLVYRQSQTMVQEAAAINAMPEGVASNQRIFGFDLLPDPTLTQDSNTLDGVESLLKTSDAYALFPFNDCLFAAMYATTRALANNPGTALTALTGAQISKGYASLVPGVVDLSGGSSITLVPTVAVSNGLPLAASTSSTHPLAGVSMYYGSNSTTGTPSITLPSQPFGISCIDTPPIDGGASDGGTLQWLNTGVTYEGLSGTPLDDGGGIGDGGFQEGGTGDAGEAGVRRSALVCP